ncbi:TRAP transporter substrate-binding protein [Cryobacterium sp. Hh7]|uniref:TRAP transporter substrate-binding protein n=1 Tax=Cryobacterium sp. Hh7 TaxID=1259159 RepID=UPI00106B2BFB|nr:TRAP transporter substrate-binding protein [Cryobacterium sp. Hh7]TFD50721.1 TRAP transporter substrate-binding protein [Cryobacterium sp. Hh7]
MMNKRIVKFATLAAVGALALTGCSGSDQGGSGTKDDSIVLIAGHQLAEGTPFDQGLKKFAELVEEKTDGRVKVEVKPNAQLGNETEMFQGLETGTVDAGIFAPGSIAEYYPSITLLSMPYLVEDRDARDQILESGILDSIEQGITDKTGTEILSYFGGSVRQMFFTEPARSIEDVEGRLFRVQPSEMLTESYQAMGLEPTVIAYNELYNALESGVVNGAENEAVFIESQKFYEAAPNILLTQHEVTFRMLMISSKTWDKLGDELTPLVREAGEEAGVFARDVEGIADEELIASLGDHDGVTVTKVDTSAWRAKMEPIWEKYAEQWGVSEELKSIEEL